MIIKPKIRGFICTTTHPEGCLANIRQQIAYVKSNGQIKNGPKRVLIVGASSGYGMATRITAAFGSGAATIGVFFEKPATEKKSGTAGWHNSAAFTAEAEAAGLYAKSLNGDAFSNAAKEKTIALIKEDLGQIDLVIYSLASPVRKLPDTGELIRSTLKPIDQPYQSTAINTNKDTLFESSVEPATEQEIADTVTVMGGTDWQLWIDALSEAGVLADGCKTAAYSYMGSDITWPIYWHGTIGRAKQHVDETAALLNKKMQQIGGQANVAVLKSVVTQASSAIPVMPLYLSMVFKVMKESNVHEGCIEQIDRLFRTGLCSDQVEYDEANRYRMDDWELRADIQARCKDIWDKVTDDNIFETTDYAYYKAEFLRLFGFGIDGIDYEQEVDTLVPFEVIDI
ncbi:MAG: trans-2-enoyl-CoA reductase family protein [Oceanospirillaceae bacterium]|nr:trans-2-enoyl-CoA reductase family protein [Oceanospirillaceae bacterium]